MCKTSFFSLFLRFLQFLILKTSFSNFEKKKKAGPLAIAIATDTSSPDLKRRLKAYQGLPQSLLSRPPSLILAIFFAKVFKKLINYNLISY